MLLILSADFKAGGTGLSRIEVILETPEAFAVVAAAAAEDGETSIWVVLFPGLAVLDGAGDNAGNVKLFLSVLLAPGLLKALDGCTLRAGLVEGGASDKETFFLVAASASFTGCRTGVLVVNPFPAIPALAEAPASALAAATAAAVTLELEYLLLAWTFDAVEE